MSDLETGEILVLVFEGLVVAIFLLGGFALARLRRERGSGRPAPSPVAQVVVGVLLFAITLVSTFLPAVALVPALMFFVLGLWLLLGAGSRRDGGIVLVLLAAVWGIFMAFQADALASGADIRADLVLSLPLMTGLGALGWRIYASARIALLQKDS